MSRPWKWEEYQIMLVRLCDYCKANIDGPKAEYLTITRHPLYIETHMCPQCWMTRGEKRRKNQTIKSHTHANVG